MLLPQQIRELRDAQDHNTLVIQVYEMMSRIGLEHFMYANIYQKNGQTVREAVSKWPTAWFSMYYSGGFFDHNHCVEYLKKHKQPLNILDVPRHTERQNQLHEMTLELGVRSGALAAVSPTKPKLGMFYACSSDGRRSTEATVRRNLPIFPVIANAIYDAFERIQKLTRAAELVLQSPVHLSELEILTLMWASEGLNNDEIALMLNRQTRSVKNYLTSAREQLGATNTAHAVAIALRNGIID